MQTRFPLLLRSMLFCCIVISLFSTAASAACVGDQQSDKIYKVSVVPQKSPSEIFSVWSLLLDQVGKKIGMCFTLTLQSSIQDFEARLLTGEPDFSWVNPYHAVMVNKKFGYMPLVKDGQSLLSGLLVVRADSSIDDLSQLKDANIAFPSPNAFAASLLIRAMLDKHNVSIKPVYVKTHTNVYRSTLVGDVKAGGGVNNTFRRESDALQKEMKVLFETPSYAPHPLIVHPRVPLVDQQAFTKAFLALTDDPKTAALLEKIPMPKPVVANYDHDYRPLEALGLERYVISGSD